MTNSFSMSHIQSILSRLDPFEDDSIIMVNNHNNSMFINSNVSNEIQEIHDGSNIKENEINDQFSNLNLLNKKEQQALDNTINLQNISVEEEFMSKDDITNLGKYTGTEPIIENIEKEDEEVNESFYHDNQNFIDNFDAKKCNLFSENFNFNNNLILNNNNIINNIVMNNTVIYSNTSLNENLGFDEINKEKIKNNIKKIKFMRNTSSFNSTNSVTKEISNLNNNKSVLSDNKKLFNVTKQNDDFITSNIKLNQSSCQLSCKAFKNKRGRKQMLLSGIKTEILDKTFLREFKKYLKLKKKEFKNVFDKDSIFWKEFLENKNPPFIFTIDGKNFTFKSYSQNFMNFIFSKNCVNTLYTRFISETKEDLKIDKIFSKKKIKKTPDNYTISFYKYYRKNLHKLYSQDYSDLDLTFDDIEKINVSTDLVSNSFH